MLFVVNHMLSARGLRSARFLNRGLEIRLVPREVKASLVRRISRPVVLESTGWFHRRLRHSSVQHRSNVLDKYLGLLNGPQTMGRGIPFWLGFLVIVAVLALGPEFLSRYQIINFSH